MPEFKHSMSAENKLASVDEDPKQMRQKTLALTQNASQMFQSENGSPSKKSTVLAKIMTNIKQKYQTKERQEEDLKNELKRVIQYQRIIEVDENLGMPE